MFIASIRYDAKVAYIHALTIYRYYIVYNELSHEIQHEVQQLRSDRTNEKQQKVVNL